jgi:putative ABC transport system permease protein
LASGQIVLVGQQGNGSDSERVLPHRVLNPNAGVVLDVQTCDVGERVATKFKLHFGAELLWEMNGKTYSCVVMELQSFGGPEDDQIFTDLESLQEETQMPHRVSLIQLSVPGTSNEIEDYVSLVRQEFPSLDVRPLRQFAEAQSKIYSRISGLLTAATAIILVLTALCVMAAMTNIAAERKRDVGMMKAIGGSARNILNLFLTEAALLGLAGGLMGAAAGIGLSIGLGKAVFGVAAAPRLIVYPISVALTVVVAILGAYPLRRLANVRPATVFRGES